MLNFSCIDNTNKLYLASAPQHLANRWRTPAKTKLNYLNLKVEIPTSDDACHILKFQQIGRRRKRRGMVWLRFEMMTEMMSINIMNYFQKGNGLSGLNILNHCGVCLFHGCTSSNSSSFIFWILFGVWGLNLRFEFGLYLNLNLLRGSGSGILLNLNPKPQVQNQVWTGFRRFPNQTAASLSTCIATSAIQLMVFHAAHKVRPRSAIDAARRISFTIVIVARWVSNNFLGGGLCLAFGWLFSDSMETLALWIGGCPQLVDFGVFLLLLLAMMWCGKDKKGKRFFYKINICCHIASCTACATTVETTAMTNQYIPWSIKRTLINMCPGSFTIIHLVGGTWLGGSCLFG